MFPRFKTCALAAALTALTTAISGAALASSVVNGSFETPFDTLGIRNGGQTFGNLQSGPGASWNIWTEIPGWTKGLSGDGIEIQSNRTLNSIDAFDGQHYVELDSNNNSSMFQDVFLAQGGYTLSFQYSPRTTRQNSNGIGYSLGTLLSGEVTGPSADAPHKAWTRITQVFNVAASGTYRLSFFATQRDDSFGGLIDDVAITPDPLGSVTPVPLPGGAVLLISAGAVLVSSRLRRKA